MDLVTFLRARLDELEADVNLANKAAGGQVPRSSYLLADVAAKRRIVERAEQYQRWAQNEDTPAFKALATAGDLMVRFLAAPFDQHPDFDPAWNVAGGRP